MVTAKDNSDTFMTCGVQSESVKKFWKKVCWGGLENFILESGCVIGGGHFFQRGEGGGQGSEKFWGK